MAPYLLSIQQGLYYAVQILLEVLGITRIKAHVLCALQYIGVMHFNLKLFNRASVLSWRYGS